MCPSVNEGASYNSRDFQTIGACARVRASVRVWMMVRGIALSHGPQACDTLNRWHCQSPGRMTPTEAPAPPGLWSLRPMCFWMVPSRLTSEWSRQRVRISLHWVRVCICPRGQVSTLDQEASVSFRTSRGYRNTVRPPYMIKATGAMVTSSLDSGWLGSPDFPVCPQMAIVY